MNEKYFFDSAFEFAKCNSTCLKVNVGAVFAVPNRRAKNGFKLYHSCNRSNDVEKNCQVLKECYKAKVTGIYESCEETRKYCSAIHAEINMIENLKIENVNPSNGVLYVTRYPCENCAKHVVEFGFTKVCYCGKQEISDEVKKIFEDNNVEVEWYPQYDYEFNYDPKSWWTEDLYNKAYDIIKDRKFPIIIPSYNRPNPSAITGFLSKMNDEFNHDIFLFVRESQKEQYEKSNTHPYVKIISFPDESISNAGAVRRISLKWLYSKGYKCAFSFDDDLQSIQYTSKGFKGDGWMKSEVQNSDNISKVLAMWQLAMEYAVDNHDVMISGLMPMFIGWKPEYCTESQSMLLYRGLPSQAVCINVKGLVDNLLIYGDNDKVGHEDIALTIECIEKKKPVCVFPFLVYGAGPMSVENWNFKDMKERFSVQQNRMKDRYGSNPWVEFPDDKRGLPQVEIKWPHVRKSLGINEYVFNIWNNGELLNE